MNNNPIISLTDSISKNVGNNHIISSISYTGNLIYLVYSNDNNNNNNNNLSKINATAQLFKNSDGKLTTINTLPIDNNYPTIKEGHASQSFKKFSIIDISHDNIIRIRILDNNLKIIKNREFTNYDTSFIGGSISNDEKYIIVAHYEKQQNKISNYGKAIIHILDANTLETITEYKQNGIFYCSPKFFSINNKLYIILLLVEDKIVKCPYKLKIYELVQNQIQFVTEVILPQLATSFDIYTRKNSVYVAIGTNKADLINEINVNINKSISTISNDGDELRLYKFKYNKIQLLFSKNMKCNIYTSIYYKLKYILCHHYQSSIYPGFFTINRLQHFEDKIIIGNCVYIMEALINFSSKFSGDGKWLIITGSHNNQDYNVNNIQLFKI